jgi:hypothetical protein
MKGGAGDDDVDDEKRNEQKETATCPFSIAVLAVV